MTKVPKAVHEEAMREADQWAGPLSTAESHNAFYQGYVKGYVTAKKPKGTQAFIATYVEVFRARYGFDPPSGGKNAAIAKRIVEALGNEEKACRIAIAYFNHPLAIFKERRHDLGTLEYYLNAVSDFAHNGSFTTRGEARQQDRRVTNAQAFAPLLERKDEQD